MKTLKETVHEGNRDGIVLERGGGGTHVKGVGGSDMQS